MKNIKKLINNRRSRSVIIALVTIIGFIMASCPSPTGDDNDDPGKDLGKKAGAAVSVPEPDSKTHNSITIKPSTFTDGNPGEQTIEYAINESNSAPSTGWQDGLKFSGLGSNTKYWIFARSKANATHNAGTASAGLLVTTDLLYRIGDTGPGGGIIFYVNSSGFTVEGYTGEEGSFSSYTAYYLEAAMSNSPTFAEWGAYGKLIPGITTFSIGTEPFANKIGNGRKDTLTIAAYLAANTTETDRAAQLAAAAAFNGLNDWFLPSAGELNLLYVQRNLTGIGITTGWFWSSTQHDISIYAWRQDFSNGIRNNYKKNNMNTVRAIRAF